MSSLCTLTGTILNADGTPACSVQVQVVVDQATDQGGQVLAGSGITSTPIEVFTDDTGAFSVSLLQGALVTLNIPPINLSKEITIPALDTVDFTTLI